jgi:hypothetical protein
MDRTHVTPLAERFFCLMGSPGEEAEFESAPQMLAALWREDAPACEALLQELVRLSRERREIFDEICLAEIEIGDDRFRDVLYALSKLRGAPRETKTRLKALLVSLANADAIRDFDKTFRSGCNRFLKGQLDEQEWYALVRQAGILRRRELSPAIMGTLEKLEHMEGRRPYLHIDTARCIETVAKALHEGRAPTVEILFSARSKASQKEAAAFALGCECDPALYDVLLRAYTEHKGPRDFPIRRECVGAIVYSAQSADLLDFLTVSLRRERKRLAQRRVRWLWYWNRDADVLRLLLAAFFSPKANDQLLQELRNWLQARKSTYLASAYLALERHGVVDPAFERAHATAIRREREFRREHFYFSELICLRNKARPL